MFRPRFIGLLLALITLLAFLPVRHYGFVNLDDGDYVTENSVVQNGLTWTGIQWAFTTGHSSNWHPVTWLSHMADCEFFALNPGAHHFVNVLFHTANVVLLFALLLRLTGKLWPSAFIAALFAWHPLHVESVAWISERKDVLSTFFALMTLLAYTKFAKGNCRRGFWIALAFFTLGLMSKPMLVTLPFVMLLLDYWPLQRFPPFWRLVFEKWPFFVLVAVSCVITYLVQQHGGMIASLEEIPLDYRLGNVPLVYARYLLKMLWPLHLAILYPLPKTISPLAVSSAAAVMISITATVWFGRKRCPYMLMGWLWFLGTLVPVIGLVQIGHAAMADRYTYFPFIGVFIALTFAVRDWANRLQFPPTVITAATVLILGGCVALTEHQLSYWRDDETLFSHAIAVTKNNCVAHNSLGVALVKQGRQAEALANFQEAIRINPHWVSAHNNLAGLLDDTGKPEEALVEYRQVMQLDLVQLNPNQSVAHGNLGRVLVELGRFDEAMSQLKEAARLDPNYPWTHFDMGQMLLKQGRDAEAIGQFREVLRLDPDNFQILAYVAHVLAADENPGIRDGQTALMYAAKANVLSGGMQPLVLDALGMACAETGDFTNALEVAQRAIDLATAVKIKNLQDIQQRLQLYKNHQPWRESFLFTNTPPKEVLRK